METKYYCQQCGKGLESKKTYCGSRKKKVGCAYDVVLVKDREHHRKHRERYAAYSRNYAKTDRGREMIKHLRDKHKAKISAYYKEWYRLGGRKRVKEQQRAHEIVARAIKRGTLVRPKDCPVCGSNAQRIEGHHKDYDKPLEVDWLCQTCHKKEHRQLCV